ncbi:MAG TPA: Hpt domain-containing protein [Acidimicrobiales bacterium]|nr:Hpt domain-containing protein [Acidimicrobiales bacterium]
MDVEYESNPSFDGDPGKLEDDVGPEIYNELLEAFLAHLTLQAVELGSASADGDLAAAQYVAHQIKGTATSFGAMRLHELAQRVLTIDGDRQDLVRSLVSELEVEICSLQVGFGASAGHR